MYTLDNIKESPSYKALSRNNFTDQEIVKYYNMSSAFERKQFFITKTQSNTIVINKPKNVIATKPTNTQMCTVASVEAMGYEYMLKTFEYKGQRFNLSNLGWTFSMNTNKTRFGVCKITKSRNFGTVSNKRIQLSSWLVTNADKSFDEWINTMLHEIAHAIDVELRGTTSHDYKWRSIALAIGCDGEVYGDFEVDAKQSKYTIKCINCGDERAGHKNSRKIARGGCSCGKCGNGYFDRDKLLIQIQNY